MDRIVVDTVEDDFWQFLDKIGEQAETNGLTEDILNKLLETE